MEARGILAASIFICVFTLWRSLWPKTLFVFFLHRTKHDNIEFEHGSKLMRCRKKSHRTKSHFHYPNCRTTFCNQEHMVTHLIKQHSLAVCDHQSLKTSTGAAKSNDFQGELQRNSWIRCLTHPHRRIHWHLTHPCRRSADTRRTLAESSAGRTALAECFKEATLLTSVVKFVLGTSWDHH